MEDGEFTNANSKTSVWWDLETCPVPDTVDPHALAQNISSTLSKYKGPVTITAFADTNKLPNVIQRALSGTGVALHHVPTGVKAEKDMKILSDMLFWAVDNPAPANYLVISGDHDFANALHQLSMRRYNILLAYPSAEVPPSLSRAAKYIWVWKTLASGQQPKVTTKDNNHLDREVASKSKSNATCTGSMEVHPMYKGSFEDNQTVSGYQHDKHRPPVYAHNGLQSHPIPANSQFSTHTVETYVDDREDRYSSGVMPTIAFPASNSLLRTNVSPSLSQGFNNSPSQARSNSHIRPNFSPRPKHNTHATSNTSHSIKPIGHHTNPENMHHSMPIPNNPHQMGSAHHPQGNTNHHSMPMPNYPPETGSANHHGMPMPNYPYQMGSASHPWGNSNENHPQGNSNHYGMPTPNYPYQMGSPNHPQGNSNQYHGMPMPNYPHQMGSANHPQGNSNHHGMPIPNYGHQIGTVNHPQGNSNHTTMLPNHDPSFHSANPSSRNPIVHMNSPYVNPSMPQQDESNSLAIPDFEKINISSILKTGQDTSITNLAKMSCFLPPKADADSLEQLEISNSTQNRPPKKTHNIKSGMSSLEHPEMDKSYKENMRDISMAMESLQRNMMAPTEQNIWDCIHYENINNIKQNDLRQCLNEAVKRKDVVVMGLGSSFKMHLLPGSDIWRCIDPLNFHNPYPDQVWRDLSAFLLSPEGHSLISKSKSRYDAAQILKNKCLTKLVLGPIIHILQLAVDVKKWLKPSHGWYPLSITVSCYRPKADVSQRGP